MQLPRAESRVDYFSIKSAYWGQVRIKQELCKTPLGSALLKLDSIQTMSFSCTIEVC